MIDPRRKRSETGIVLSKGKQRGATVRVWYDIETPVPTSRLKRGPPKQPAAVGRELTRCRSASSLAQQREFERRRCTGGAHFGVACTREGGVGDKVADGVAPCEDGEAENRFGEAEG
eukprot:5465458-Prymnesium_polylepis.4